MVSPVMFPPGRERLEMRPAPRMSSLNATMGIVSVACWATRGRDRRALGHVNLQPDQVSGKLGKLLQTRPSEAEFDRHAAAFN
jgi:hypothetical protein